MVTVVIVTYNSAARIGNCLVSLIDHLPEAEIVVVDNASSDKTEQVVTSTAPGARFLKRERNLGFGRACNFGVATASHEDILLVNPDVTVQGVDRRALSNLLAQAPRGLIAPALDGPPDQRLFSERSWVRDFLDHTAGTLRPREWRPWRTSHRRRDDIATWVNAAMLLLQRREFSALGGFDPRFFLYYEDRDLARRYRTAGLPIRPTGAVVGVHAGGESSANDGLRVIPMAWSLLGWIQFLYIHEGERVARRAALSTLGTLRAIRLGLHGFLVGAPRWERLRRKAQQLDELFDLLHAKAQQGDDEFCPDALRILRAANSPNAASAVQ